MHPKAQMDKERGEGSTNRGGKEEIGGYTEGKLSRD